MFGNTWQNAAIGLGIGCSLFYGVLLSNVPVVKNIEDRMNDSLILMHNSGEKTDKISLINISADKQTFLKPAFYADLSERLLREEAAVVVLNFPDSWETQVGGEDGIVKLVKKYHDRIVLVVRTSAINPSRPNLMPIYNHFLPFKNDAQPEVDIDKIQSFFEYDYDSKNPTVLVSPARKIQSVGTFLRSDYSLKTQIKLKSAPWLALHKYYRLLHHQESDILSPSSGQIHFSGITGTFKSIELDDLCFTAIVTGSPTECTPIKKKDQQENEIFRQFRHKIVLIGVTQQHDYLSFAGKRMPALEVQANLINSLMTNSLYKTAPDFLYLGMVLVGVVIISKFMIGKITKPSNGNHHWGILPIVGVICAYGGLYILCFYNGVIFPIALPVLVWIITGISLGACLGIAQLLKQDEIKQRQLAEKKAAVLQARKLLYRIASDIHDRPLQELKVVMDRMEIWQFDHPNINAEPILDKLLQVNRDIRTQLNDIRTIADKLKITPELRSGLDNGIRSKLDDLLLSGELTLQVIENIQPLDEPEFDSAWIDAREDIFRFFREAIANVICHAQPPQGNATTLQVSLFQEGDRCVLIVKNDGLDADASVVKRHSGGYGTKIMETIATELPGGTWERFISTNGDMVVKLVWKLREI